MRECWGGKTLTEITVLQLLSTDQVFAGRDRYRLNGIHGRCTLPVSTLKRTSQERRTYMLAGFTLRAFLVDLSLEGLKKIKIKIK